MGSAFILLLRLEPTLARDPNLSKRNRDLGGQNCRNSLSLDSVHQSRVHSSRESRRAPFRFGQRFRARTTKQTPYFIKGLRGCVSYDVLARRLYSRIRRRRVIPNIAILRPRDRIRFVSTSGILTWNPVVVLFRVHQQRERPLLCVIFADGLLRFRFCFG